MKLILFGWIALLAGPALEPFPARIGGWQMEGEAEKFVGRELFKAIDGGAEIYLSYGFEKLLTASFARDESRMDAYFYHMSSPLAAWGIFQRERPEKSISTKAAAAAAFRGPNLCTFLKGSVYVKLVAMKGKLDQAECKALVESAAAGLQGPTDLPPELGLLPGAGLVAGTEGMEPGGHLGLSELGRVLFATYKKNEKEFELFVLLEKDGKSAGGRFDELAGAWKEIPNAPWPAKARDVPYEGPVVLVKTPKAVMGISGAKSEKEAMELLRAVLPANR